MKTSNHFEHFKIFPDMGSAQSFNEQLMKTAPKGCSTNTTVFKSGFIIELFNNGKTCGVVAK